MKTHKLILAYIISFVTLYLLLSLLGLLFHYGYFEILLNWTWASGYIFLIGWWAAALVLKILHSHFQIKF